MEITFVLIRNLHLISDFSMHSKRNTTNVYHICYSIVNVPDHSLHSAHILLSLSRLFAVLIRTPSNTFLHIILCSLFRCTLYCSLLCMHCIPYQVKEKIRLATARMCRCSFKTYLHIEACDSCIIDTRQTTFIFLHLVLAAFVAFRHRHCTHIRYTSAATSNFSFEFLY